MWFCCVRCMDRQAGRKKGLSREHPWAGVLGLTTNGRTGQPVILDAKEPTMALPLFQGRCWIFNSSCTSSSWYGPGRTTWDHSYMRRGKAGWARAPGKSAWPWPVPAPETRVDGMRVLEGGHYIH